MTDLHLGRIPRRPDGVAAELRAAWPTVLVSMPFVDVHRPSIQLGLLKAIVAGHGFPVRTLSAHLDFAARIGVDLYQFLTDHRGWQLGDWLFSVEAFGDTAPDPDGRLLDDVGHVGWSSSRGPERLRDRLLRAREADVPSYLDALVDMFPWDDARVVGFTSTFQQNTASFALARRLKDRDPNLVTVFGGANFDGEMGLEFVRSVDCVDLAVIGEGDVALPTLLHALATGGDPALVPGVAATVDGQVRSTPPGPVTRLDDLPAPDYDEHFEHAEALGLLPRVGHRTVWLPVETARGCWWGAKHHCTFCGLNGTSMGFRSKSADTVGRELAALARRYRTFRFEAVDNILDLGYLTTLLPALVAADTNYEMFYEVKANLNRAQLGLMRRAGVVHIQPGLESLSSHVLRLMRKGVNAAQNVNLLRWARYYDIDVSWNLLWGFPGETEADYAEQAAVVPHLLHLRPPGSADRVWMERFSPLYETARVRARAPERSYRHIYPTEVDVDAIAYFFDYELDDALPEHAYAGLRRAVREWSTAWQDDRPPTLKFWSAPHVVQIHDGRQQGEEGSYTFEGVLADIYLACVDRPVTAAAVRRKLGSHVPVETVREALTEFQRRGLVFLDGQLAVALALPVAPQR